MYWSVNICDVPNNHEEEVLAEWKQAYTKRYEVSENMGKQNLEDWDNRK